MTTEKITDLLKTISPGHLRFGDARMALVDIEAGFWGIRRQIEALIGAKLTSTVLEQAGANGGASFATSFGKAKNPAEQGKLFESCLQSYQIAGFGKFEIAQASWPIGRVLIRAQDSFEVWMMQRHGQQVEGPVCAYTAGVLVGFVNVVSDRQDVVCIERKCQALGDDSCEFELLPAQETDEKSYVAFTPDPGLGRQLNLLEMLFDRMPMGIAILDRKYRVQRFNPTWIEYSERYAPPSGAPLVPGINYFDHLPGTESVVLPLFERVVAGETVQQNSVRLEAEGIVSYWDVVLAPLVEDDDVAGILIVSVDATERATLQQNLEQRVKDRTSELKRRQEIAESMRDVIGMINSKIPLETFLERAVQLAAQRIGAAACVLHQFNLTDQTISQAASFGMVEVFSKHGTRHFDALKHSGGEAYLKATLQRKPTYTNYPPLPERVDEIRRDPSIPDEIKAERIALREKFAGSFSVPIYLQDDVYGGMVFYYTEPQEFTDEQIQLGLTFAEQVSLAIENARLHEQAEQIAVAHERNRLARDLHDAVSQTLFSASLIADVLPKLWDRNPEAGRQKLDELRLLTRGALSEMRTLLLELRPASLADMELGDLLRHLTNAFTGRTRIPVESNIDGQIDPSPDVKEVFYRVAQEALNNITKHAEASQVTVHLQLSDKQVHLKIEDDGRGFDVKAVTFENLGLDIMRERAQAIDAQLVINSELGKGTYIELNWKENQE